MSKFGGFFVVSMEGVRIVRVEQKTSWWFQPIRKILVKLDHFPKDQKPEKNLKVLVLGFGRNVCIYEINVYVQ